MSARASFTPRPPVQAIRNPKRGKAHRSSKKPGVPAEYAGDTVCGKHARDMTEQVPVHQTDPADRCVRCWAGTTWGCAS